MEKDGMENLEEERKDIQQIVSIEVKEINKSVVMLSFLSLQSIMQYIDVHKRLMMSICNREICKLEKFIPLYISILEIWPSSIRIDCKIYNLGEIINVDEFLSEQNDSSLEIRTNDIQYVNRHGGWLWNSSGDDVPESGDVVRGKLDWMSNYDRKRKSQELRHCFLSSLEKYLDTKENTNPMNVFERLVTAERTEWPRQMMRIFEEIRGFMSEIESVFREELLVNYENVQDDELSEMYPNAIRLMKSRMEEMIRLGDIRACALKKLIFPLPVLQHFNQFSIFLYLTEKYSIRLVDGLSLRRAFKQFVTRIFGGRRVLQVGRLKFRSFGIFPLPVGLKFDCEQIYFEDQDQQNSITTLYDVVVRKVNNIYVSMFPGETSFFQSSVIQNCNILQICPFLPNEGTTGLRLLDNEKLHLGIKNSPIDSGFTIIRSWMENRNRRIRSKLIIAFDKETCQGNIRDTVNSYLLVEKGFEKTRRAQLFHLPENRMNCFEITLRKDRDHFTESFLKNIDFEFYCHVEIVH